MIDKLKLADRRYKEAMPTFARMTKKYDRMKTRGDQAAKEAIEHKQRVALLESQLQECQKVCNNLKQYIHSLPHTYKTNTTFLCVHTHTGD